MTNQAERIQNAIRHIRTSVDIDPWAMELAVEALEKELKNSTDELKNSTDTISRQAAIDTLRTMQTYKLLSANGDMLLVNKAEAQTELMLLPSVQPKPDEKDHQEQGESDKLGVKTGETRTDANLISSDKYEYHYDHTDCIWYRPEARNRCPSTCAQYRDGWNDAMNYIFRDGKGYRPYRRDRKYEDE